MYVQIQVYQYTHVFLYMFWEPRTRLHFVSQQPISVMINPCLRLPLIGVRQAWMKKGFASHSGQQRSIDADKSDFLIAGWAQYWSDQNWGFFGPWYARHARDPFGCVIHLYFRTPELSCALVLRIFPTQRASKCQSDIEKISSQQPIPKISPRLPFREKAWEMEAAACWILEFEPFIPLTFGPQSLTPPWPL